MRGSFHSVCSQRCMLGESCILASSPTHRETGRCERQQKTQGPWINNKKRVDHIPEKRHSSEFHNGEVQKPIEKKCDVFSGREGPSGQRVGQVVESTGFGLQKKVKPKSDVDQQARKDGRPVHFASLLDLCHLEHIELVKHLHTYKGETRAPRGQRQGQYSRIKEHQLRKWQQQRYWIQAPWHVKETNDATSAYTQLHLSCEMHYKCRPECPQVWMRLPPSRRRNNGTCMMEEPVVVLERNL